MIHTHTVQQTERRNTEKRRKEYIFNQRKLRSEKDKQQQKEKKKEERKESETHTYTDKHTIHVHIMYIAAAKSQRTVLLC
jgi:hypothetical protein